MKLALFGVLFSFAVFAQEAIVPVVMETSKGTIHIDLNESKAPKTVKNFLRYVDDGFYKDTIFHRVISGFMIQGGGFTANMREKKTHGPIEHEGNTGLSNETGTIAMARTGDPHSATAQFFINVENNGRLDYTSSTPQGYGYVVFGKVTKGMDVVNLIKSVKLRPDGDHVPAETVLIKSITRAKKK